jgi:hypothetical protein
MLLFSMYVDNEYTAKKMEIAAKKLGFDMIWQWVTKGKGKTLKNIVACDFLTKN